MIELGGNITLTGFKELDRDTLIVVKKIVGSYVKQISEKNGGFQSLTVTLKGVHGRETAEKYELHTNLMADRQYNAEVVDRNLMFALDKVLKKTEASMK